jgi:hypothetical protein
MLILRKIDTDTYHLRKNPLDEFSETDFKKR